MIDIKVFGSGSSGNCYLANINGDRILLEAGLPYKKIQKAMDYKVYELEGCLVTHEHMDHAKAVKDLLKAGVDCYLSQGTIEALGLKSHRLKPLKKSDAGYKKFSVGELEVLPFEAVHDVAEPVSFYIRDKNTQESMAFITDTAYIKYKIPSVDVLMVECNYIKEKIDENVKNGSINLSLRNRIIKNHLSLETLLEALKVADLSKCKKIYLLHLSNDNSDKMIMKTEIQKITGCEVWCE